MNSTWDLFYIGLAEMWANKSKDRSVGVGAIIVGPDMEQRSAGYNGFPRGIDDTIECRHERPLKYDFTEHAERNAIFNAARVGTPLNGCVLYLNWCPDCACPDCARAVIQSGITTVIGPDRSFRSGVRAGAPTSPAKDWELSFITTNAMFKEAGIITRVVNMGDYVRNET